MTAIPRPGLVHHQKHFASFLIDAEQVDNLGIGKAGSVLCHVDPQGLNATDFAR
jgi:hypothetical protein